MSKSIKYLCIDDAGDEATTSYLNFISDQEEGLSILPREPEDFVAQLDTLKNKLKPIDENGFDGLVLDLRLDGEDSLAQYRAPALAQEIHTRAVESEERFPICPLVLWSNDDKLRDSYWPDDTSHDLFDLIIFKEILADLDEEYAKWTARKLVALAEGYATLNEAKEMTLERVAILLGTDALFLSKLDPRIVLPLTRSYPDVSTYDQARTIRHHLLAVPNSALVTSEVLAARLGLKMDEVEDFDALAERLFAPARYNGVFSYGWTCWWMPMVEKLWRALPGRPGHLRELTAEQRVDFIKTYAERQDITPAQKIEWTTSSSFWTICQITRRPLDPMDGYVVDRYLQPWQLTQYVSLYGKIRGKNAERIKVDPLDIERFNEDNESR